MRLLLLLAAAVAVTTAGGSLHVSESSPATAPGSSASGPPSGEVVRVSGEDRVATAAAVAEGYWDSAEVAVVATARQFPDALAGVPIAGLGDAPLLLTEPDHLPAAVARALDELGVDEVVLLGGPAAVDDSVFEGLAEGGRSVTRIGGEDRYHTAALAASRAGTSEEALVASGENFPDALSAGTLTAIPPHAPLVLTTPNRAHPRASAALAELDASRALVLGGPSAVADDVVAELERVMPLARRAGEDRYGTSLAAWEDALVRRGGAGPLVVATGERFPDGLAAGALAARIDGSLLLSPAGRLTDELDAAIRERAESITGIVVVGGEAALDAFVEAELQAALAGEDRPRPPADPVDVALTEIATGLDAPWDVVFRGDGEVLVTERDSGRVLDLGADGATTEIHTFDVNAEGEGGLLGLTERPETGELYAYYTGATDNRVVRFDPGGSEEVVFDGIPRGDSHNGGRLAFGPDGMLYVATGDAGDGARSQDEADPAGAILRLEPDGQVPDDNPFDGSPVYATGIRNSQGLAWDDDERLWAAEFGPDVHDEVNVIEAGGNYGWPVVTGAPGDDRFIDAAFVRQPAEASWSGLEVLVDGAIPQWEGDVFVAALRGQRLWRLSVDGGEVVGSEQLLVSDHGRLREVTQAPDGSLWVVTNNTDGRGQPREGDDRILRLGPGFEGGHGPLSSETRERMQGTSWEPGCPVDLDDLAQVEVEHWDFGHQVRQGRLVVAADVADETVAVFDELYGARFPLEEVAVIDDYDGDDDAAMAANASTAFNCRRITGGNRFSEHAYGTAIDLNPRQNPYRRDGTVLPPEGSAYLDRGDVRPGMIVEGGPAVTAFDSRGWDWGGRWSSLDDWMHFEKRR